MAKFNRLKQVGAKLKQIGQKIWGRLPGGKKTKIALLAVLGIVLLLLLSRCGGGGAGAPQEAAYVEVPVERRTIASDLSGSGTLQPANSYTVTTLLEGEILADYFEEGDVIAKDAVLYEMDSSDATGNLERAELSLRQAERNYQDAQDKAKVRSDVAGEVAELSVKVGDVLRQGDQVAVIRDSATMLLTVPFPADDAKGFYVGEAATVTLDGTFEQLAGKVESISGSDIVGQGNMITRNVKIAVSNPGGLANTQAATASVGGVQCAGGGTFEYQAEQIVTAEAGGTVSKLNVSEGEKIKADTVLVTLSGSELENQIQSAADNLRSAQLSMENTQDQMDNYTISSPISGTVVSKEYKAGDKTADNKTLCTIYDLSYLEMTLNVDELDVSQVKVGQTAEITAEAVEGKTYTGTVTKVSVAGTTNNGVTSYPVTIQLTEYDGLLPGMNAEATIMLASAEDTLAVPTGAVSRGDVVLVTKDSPSAVNAIADREAPEGYVYVPVVTGVSDDSYIAITSGLAEGDTVAYQPSGGGMMMQGGMGGGPEGGAPPDGGPGGGGPH